MSTEVVGSSPIAANNNMTAFIGLMLFLWDKHGVEGADTRTDGHYDCTNGHQHLISL